MNEMIKAARNMREHAWLARLRKGNASMSDFAAQQIAEYIDTLLALVAA